MCVRALIFDLFHTLVDVGSAPGAAGRYTADILGVDRSRWREACFSHVHEICRPTEQLEVVRALAHGIDPAIPEHRIVEAAAERQQRFDHALLNIHADVLDALKAFKAQGLRLGLVSNASSGEVAAWGMSPLAGLFDVAVFSCDCGHRKPEPAIYLAALQQLGTSAAETVFIGDGGSDELQGANSVGLHTILITRYLGSMESSRLQARRAVAGWEIGDLTELDELLGEMGTTPAA